MTTPGAIRTAVGDLVDAAVPAGRAVVHRYPPGQLVEFPSVIVGQTAWEPGENNWAQLWTVSVSIVVARPGTDDQATIVQLEELWPDVLTALDQAIEQDQTLGGVCNAAWVARARPGQIEIAGVRYPATAIEIQLHG